MKPTTLSTLLALALAGSAWATSPYDTAYGLQWNYQIGTSGQDAFQTQATVVSDGTLFVTNRTSLASWGSGTAASICGGVGAITPLGKLIYGTTLRSLPGMTNPGQNYLTGITAVGNTAYIGINGGGNQYWAGQDTTDGNRVMTFSLDSSGLSSIANQHRLTIYKTNAGALRTDGLGPNLPNGGLATLSSQNRSLESAMRASTLDMIIVGNTIGEFGTTGDYGSGPAQYGCFVGRYNLGTNTLTGPAKQPVIWNATNTTIIRGDYTRCAIDQNSGRYYAACATSANSAFFDPDGSNALPPVALDAASLNAIVVAYDISHNVLYTVVWDSPTAGATTERINAIVPTNDGTDSVFFAGYTTGDMPAVTPGTNLNPTVNSDSYIELRDKNGVRIWFDQLAISGLSDGITAAEVLANGDLIVTGYRDTAAAGIRDSWIRKYKKTGPGTYVAAWPATTIVNALDPTNTKNDQVQDSAFESTGDAVYLTVQSLSQWNNTTGHVVAGTNDDILVHKLSPGDFNTDGFVNFADVQIAGTATKPGLPVNDTYDFNGDGDSTLADTTYMITNIMDRLVGDIAQDTLVTDVDNADIGRAIGSVAASGKLYLDGDIDFDGDVDNADITAMAAALSFTGAKSPGKWTNGTPGATLRYRASDGQVWLHADEAAGSFITSFQLENSAGTFDQSSFTGPTGGGFDGALKEATGSVLADTDLSLGGVGSIVSLGPVFPTGMNLAGLTAYLKTAVYTGQPGSGQMRFTLVRETPYTLWAAGPFASTLTNNAADFDFDSGGLETGIEWVVGGDPTVGGDDSGNTPTLTNTDPTYFRLVFKRRDAAAADADTDIRVQYGTNLTTWRNTTDHGAADGVIVDDSVDLGGGFHQVTVSIPKALAAGGKLFARVRVVVTM